MSLQAYVSTLICCLGCLFLKHIGPDQLASDHEPHFYQFLFLIFIITEKHTIMLVKFIYKKDIYNIIKGTATLAGWVACGFCLLHCTENV